MSEETVSKNSQTAQQLIAWNLRYYRVRNGISQNELALGSGVDRTTVSRLERGIDNPSIGNIEKLAKTLGIHISSLFMAPDVGAEEPKSLRRGRKKQLT
jgi:transcriptional regulator with XRE-family HTH domain